MIIGIGHKARQGKDSAAKCLEEKYGFTKIGFADALKEECKNCRMTYLLREGKKVLIKDFEWSRDTFEATFDDNMIEWIKEKGEFKRGYNCDYFVYNGMTEKDPILMQFWGTDLRRKQDEDYWVKKVKKVIDKVPDKDYVIPDTRFKNEAKMIKDLGGEVWKVVRYNEVLHSNSVNSNKEIYVDDSRDPNHPSETDLNNYPFDATISAESGDLKGLYEQIDIIMNLK